MALVSLAHIPRSRTRDIGVGCAQAIINGWLTRSEPSCDC